MSEQDSTAPVEYRAIEGYPGYRIGSDGTVLSYWRRHGCKPATIGETSRKLAMLIRSGYCRVALKNAKGEQRFSVHHLVLNAFVGPRPDGTQACHNNGNKSDNRVSNLRWDTPSANHADQVIHGTVPRGERSGKASLTEADVHEIRRRLCCGEGYRRIAKDFGVLRAAIRSIKIGRCWSWLKSPYMPPKFGKPPAQLAAEAKPVEGLEARP